MRAPDRAEEPVDALAKTVPGPLHPAGYGTPYPCRQEFSSTAVA